jgi:hypothetical protein
MPDGPALRSELTKAVDGLIHRLLSELRKKDESIAVVASPPGAGKTTTLLRLCHELAKHDSTVGIVCQTNHQANDVARRLAALRPSCPIVRFISTSSPPGPRIDGTLPISRSADFPDGKKIVIGTAAKWSLIDDCKTLDAMLIDEAWQMTHATLLPILRFSGRILMIGDPGQIPPVVPTPTERWETSRNPPHLAAPDVVLRRLQAPKHQLPATWRLPSDSADIIAPFYDFVFGSAAQPGERRFSRAGRGPDDRIDQTLEALHDRSMALLLLPSPRSGTLAIGDREVASAIAATTVRAIETGAVAESTDGAKPIRRVLGPQDIGISATRREMVQAIADALPAELRAKIHVDTAERWQGLECELMIIAHPLSSVRDPSAFDLETGRLCVMASRHRSGLIVVSRDHVPETLATVMPSAEQPLGREDVVGRGLFLHRAFWAEMHKCT